MPLLALALVPLVVLLAIVLMPVSLVQRYRLGTARRQARGWLATLNLVALSVSTLLFLLGAAVTTVWVRPALPHALLGLAAGGLLGLVGLRLSRWEPGADALHYTPNRWLVLALTLLVAGRIGYGFWRSYLAWRSGLDDPTWVAAAGVAGSLAAGGLVLGYYLVFWAGVRRRALNHPRPWEPSGRRRSRPW